MKKDREQWTSRLGFILAATGSAVGLGNIWRFSYVAGVNGGALFLILYTAFILLVGYPLMVTEISVGKITSRNPVGAFKALSEGTPWWLVGALGVFAGFIILSFYSIVAGWSLAYVIKAVRGFGSDMDFAGTFVGHISSVWPPIIWHGIFMLITIGLIAMGVVNGIQRASKILMPVLFGLLLILIIRSITLPGAGEGIAFYLKPDLSELSFNTILAAIGQAFFSLSLGMGAMITYGSYLKDKEDVNGSAAWIAGLDSAVAILAGFAIFPAVFALNMDPAAGPGLAFITIPAVFAQMPLGYFFGILFFILLSVAAVTSAISLLEVVVAWVVDEKGWSRKKAALMLGGVIFLLGIPATLGYSLLSGVSFFGLDILDTYDLIASEITLPLGGLLMALFVGIKWKARSVREFANSAPGMIKIGKWYDVLITYLIPVMVGFVLIFGLISKFRG